MSYAQPDTLAISAKDLKVKQLKPGTRQYLVTVQTPGNPKVLTQSLWNRKVSYQTIDGKERLVIRQNWIGTDTLSHRAVYSICKKNFVPIYHTSTIYRGTLAYNFYADRVEGTDTTVNNAAKGFKVALQEATFNWELDLEFFESLPLKANTVYKINFYHPGSKAGPKDYLYEVTGSEKLTTINNTSVECWQLKIDYGSSNYAIFWIAKKTHEVLKMEERFNSVKRYKVKLGTNAGTYI
ncbi:hypothetical protein ACFSKU_13785 [Pontibacter silvestris]|uniref:Uncharacterized protein n=1 Tax=Pontibacter silvestris TaxID=2305183 RepID=A0ABW4X008_9BACT|nr:hypothetical protein [Pontibacter silvestris]MCC9135479.1 hypothetical protein [Pontibacter silvestris]